MPQRKAALIGAQIGPEVATHNMRAPQLVVSCRDTVTLRVTQWRDGAVRETTYRVRQADRLALAEATWTRIEVLEGEAEKVLCVIESRRS